MTSTTPGVISTNLEQNAYLDEDVNERTPLIDNTHETSSPTSTYNQGRKFPQYCAAISATLGALAAGMVLAWPSAAGTDGINLAKEYNITISADQFSWIGSLVNLGAAASCIPIGILADLIGRKRAMLLLTIPFTVGWLLILFAQSVIMIYLGRFMTGLSGGAFCVTAPMYTAEISQHEIRGALGSLFQLMITTGILCSYFIGAQVNTMFQLSLLSAIVPILFFIIFVFMPESPIYHLKKSNEADARSCLKRLRGSEYDIEQEIHMHLQNLRQNQTNEESFLVAIKSRAVRKGLLIGSGLMFFQQFSGVNAILFYAAIIFASFNKFISPQTSAIVIGCIQVMATFLSTLIVDKINRKTLLFISDFFLFLTTGILGFYYYLLHIGSDVSSVDWLPLVLISVFIFMFSIGFGPIPWIMASEIFSPSVKGVAGSSVCVINWLMAFIVTKYFLKMQEWIGDYTTFWIFSMICLLGSIFSCTVVIETRGKSLAQIQNDMNGDHNENNS